MPPCFVQTKSKTEASGDASLRGIWYKCAEIQRSIRCILRGTSRTPSPTALSVSLRSTAPPKGEQVVRQVIPHSSFVHGGRPQAAPTGNAKRIRRKTTSIRCILRGRMISAPTASNRVRCVLRPRQARQLHIRLPGSPLQIETAVSIWHQDNGLPHQCAHWFAMTSKKCTATVIPHSSLSTLHSPLSTLHSRLAGQQKTGAASRQRLFRFGCFSPWGPRASSSAGRRGP